MNWEDPNLRQWSPSSVTIGHFRLSSFLCKMKILAPPLQSMIIEWDDAHTWDCFVNWKALYKCTEKTMWRQRPRLEWNYHKLKNTRSPQKLEEARVEFSLEPSLLEWGPGMSWFGAYSFQNCDPSCLNVYCLKIMGICYSHPRKQTQGLVRDFGKNSS